jgi:hypothetical protein
MEQLLVTVDEEHDSDHDPKYGQTASLHRS